MQAQELWSIGRRADIRSRLVTPERGAGVCEFWLRPGASGYGPPAGGDHHRRAWISYPGRRNSSPVFGGLLIPRSERYGDGWLRGPVIRQKWRFGYGYGQDQDRPTALAALVLPEAAAEPLVEPLPKTSERLTEEPSRLPGYARPSRAA